MPPYAGDDMSQGDMTIPKAMPRDAELSQMLEHTAKEAQEQIHFHRSQLGMWERVSSAAQAGLEMLSADQPDDDGPMEQEWTGLSKMRRGY